MVRAAQQPRSKGVQDGVAAYTDPATGLDFHCAFGAHQVPSPAAHVFDRLSACGNSIPSLLKGP